MGGSEHALSRGASAGHWAPSRPAAWLITGLAVASVAFEQSPANEALRTAVGLDVLRRTSSASAVGLATAVLTLVIEAVPVGLITAGLSLNTRLREKLRARLNIRVPEDAGGGNGRTGKLTFSDAGIALGIGAGLVVVKHHMMNEHPTPGGDLRRGMVAATVVAIFSGIIGWLVGGGIDQADAVGLGTPARWFVDVATDWRFWVGSLGVYWGVTWMRRRMRRHRESSGN